MSNSSRFKIHFFRNCWAFELYNSEGDYCYTLEEAVAAAKEQYPGEEWEVYNGQEGYSTKEIENNENI